MAETKSAPATGAVENGAALVQGIRTVGVVGCGLMGSGIAQVAAQTGYTTLVHEPTTELLAKGRGRIEKFLEGGVSKGKMTAEQRDATLGRLTGTTNLEEFASADLVIEAVIENIDAKKSVYGALDRVCGPQTIFASNTSSISITELAASTSRPDRFLGMHFFNPVPIMKLVELVRTILASDETMTRAEAFARSLGKTTILAKDSPGFVVNLLLVPYLLDAVRALQNGLASREDIDTGMQLGCGHPMGPLTLLDFVGIDTTYYIAEIMFDEFKDPRYAPPPLLKQLVLAGHLGRKSGRGIYDYSSGSPK
jgi:3-hydroxybutyryl-CoA dehydrogenase